CTHLDALCRLVSPCPSISPFFSFTHPSPTEIYPLSLHDALPILSLCTLEPRKNLAHLIRCFVQLLKAHRSLDIHLVLAVAQSNRSEEHTSELQSLRHLVCRLLLEKKKKKKKTIYHTYNTYHTKTD